MQGVSRNEYIKAMHRTLFNRNVNRINDKTIENMLNELDKYNARQFHNFVNKMKKYNLSEPPPTCKIIPGLTIQWGRSCIRNILRYRSNTKNTSKNNIKTQPWFKLSFNTDLKLAKLGSKAGFIMYKIHRAYKKQNKNAATKRVSNATNKLVPVIDNLLKNLSGPANKTKNFTIGQVLKPELTRGVIEIINDEGFAKYINDPSTVIAIRAAVNTLASNRKRDIFISAVLSSLQSGLLVNPTNIVKSVIQGGATSEIQRRGYSKTAMVAQAATAIGASIARGNKPTHAVGKAALGQGVAYALSKVRPMVNRSLQKRKMLREIAEHPLRLPRNKNRNSALQNLKPGTIQLLNYLNNSKEKWKKYNISNTNVIKWIYLQNPNKSWYGVNENKLTTRNKQVLNKLNRMAFSPTPVILI